MRASVLYNLLGGEWLIKPIIGSRIPKWGTIERSSGYLGARGEKLKRTIERENEKRSREQEKERETK